MPTERHNELGLNSELTSKACREFGVGWDISDPAREELCVVARQAKTNQRIELIECTPDFELPFSPTNTRPPTAPASSLST
eukprot:scaffold1967_cov199-Alexandrium_tamarense.AAC.37